MTRTRLLVGVSILAAGAAGGLYFWRTHNIGSVERGRRAAEARGCFGCHGPGGLPGLPDPGRGIGGVPPFSAEEVQTYARDEAEIREWILDGMPRRLRDEAGEGPGPLLRMPAWRGVIGERETDDLVAYVKAVSDFVTPDDPRAEEGREAASRLGCFGCHGPQGRGNTANPRSLKGYIPSWDGADFTDLAHNESEVREWILDGSPRRLRDNRLAAFFLTRQMLQMPAYRGKIDDVDVEKIVAYVRWLRKPER